MGYYVGVDAGSVSINCAVIDERGRMVFESPYLRHFGLVHKETHRLLIDILRRFDSREILAVAFTGMEGQSLAETLSAPYEVETIAQVVGAVHLSPGVRTIISMGGQDAALFQLSHEGDRWNLESFNMNGPCASGTGSFIDQQAERLSLSLHGADFEMDQEKLQQVLDDFIALGLESAESAPVACRCTVFTKSDMVHLQNKGEPLPNIIAGLHFGNAANYASTLAGNRELLQPMIFIGGMASNALQVKALQHYFPSLRPAPAHTSVGALGAALRAREQGLTNAVDLSRLEGLGERDGLDFPRAARLELRLTRFDSDDGPAPGKLCENSLSLVRDGVSSQPVSGFGCLAAPLPWREGLGKGAHAARAGRASRAGGSLSDAFLGIDIGSTTTKYALIDGRGRILHKRYEPTRGRPIEVARQLLGTLNAEAGGRVRLAAVSTTGSGRNVVGDFVGANLIIDEITAHARGAVEVDPNVDTIFEIGGQDSKYIHLERTHPLDFDMNKVCAAGTGSFLHELASKMKIDIVGEFQEIALSAKDPIHLAERCTVFMESDLVSYARKGARREDLIAGLCYAIVYNYLNRVVEKRVIGKRVMFLGGPSLNRGIVAAFERVLDRPLLVPKHREVMGALGAALAVRDGLKNGVVAKGPGRDPGELARVEVGFKETVCRADKICRNECKLKVYSFGGRGSIWGGECGRYEAGSRDGSPATPNLFEERQRRFLDVLERAGIPAAEERTPSGRDGLGPTIGSGATIGLQPTVGLRPTVGIPLALHGLDLGIFWALTFAKLGWRVVASPRTSRGIARGGVECMTAETCYPVKVFHGHVRYLLDRSHYVFLPNVINLATEDPREKGSPCPFVESSQFMARAVLQIPDERLIRPTLYLKDGPELLAGPFMAGFPAGMAPERRKLGKALAEAWEEQAAFRAALSRRGREALAGAPCGEPVWVVTGRPYNLYDERVNLQLGKHLSKLGIVALPMDFVDADSEDLSDFPGMYWGLGARILRTARKIARTPNWHGVHITNFGCGADSFIEHFYRHILGESPSLILETDEHSAAAGLLTRIEAYRNVVGNLGRKDLGMPCAGSPRGLEMGLGVS